MTAVLLSPSPILQFFNNSGQPNAGGSLLTQVGGVNYPTYQDSAGTIPLPNPIPLNSRGEVSNSSGTSVQLFLTAGVTYTFTLYDANNNQLNQSTYVVPLGSFTPSSNSIFANQNVSTQIVLNDITDKNLGSSYIGYDQGGTGAVARTVQSKLQETVSVLDFGADPTGVNDSTAAFQAAFNAAKGSDGTSSGRNVFSVYIPSYPNGFYKITNTLVIDGTSGLKIFGDGAFTQRNDFPGTSNTATIRWYGSSQLPIFQIKGQVTTISNPNFNIKIQDLTIAGYPTSISSTSLPSNCALSGIHFGDTTGSNQSTLNRQCTIENVFISDCRFGIWSGNPDGLNTDHAPIRIDGCEIINNSQAGIYWGTGNAIGQIYSCYIGNNGWGALNYPADNYSPQIGANINLNSGYLDIISLTSNGFGSTQPYSADVYQGAGRMSVLNAWSDTHGLFFKQGSSSQINNYGYQIAQITGVRHWEGTMTATDTPDSIEIISPGTVVMGCSFYGNVRITSGESGKPVIGGIQFGRSDSTFVGTGVNTQRSLLALGTGPGNNAQISMGGTNAGVPFVSAGNNPPANLLFANDSFGLMELIPASSTGTGFSWLGRGDDANGAHVLSFNCYYSSAAGGFVPYQNTKQCVQINLGGPNGLQVFVADPNGSSGVLNFIEAGGILAGGVQGARTEVAWQFPQMASDPTFTSGNWWIGSVYYNTTLNKLRVNVGGGTWQTISSA